MSRWDVRDAVATPTGEPAQPSPAQAGATDRTHLSPTSCCARSQFSPFLLSWFELGFLSLATEGLLTILGSLFRISMSWPLSVCGLQALWEHDPCLIYLLSPTAPGRILWTGRSAKYNGILFSLLLSRTDINQIQNPSANPSVYMPLRIYACIFSGGLYKQELPSRSSSSIFSHHTSHRAIHQYPLWLTDPLSSEEFLQPSTSSPFTEIAKSLVRAANHS